MKRYDKSIDYIRMTKNIGWYNILIWIFILYVHRSLLILLILIEYFVDFMFYYLRFISEIYHISY